MTRIQDYIRIRLQKCNQQELGDILGVTPSMISKYKLGKNLPSLEVAKTIYRLSQISIHPFSEESIVYEITKGLK